MVYGPQEDNAKLAFLQEIKEIQVIVEEKWLLIGDFNMILQAQDKSLKATGSFQCCSAGFTAKRD